MYLLFTGDADRTLEEEERLENSQLNIPTIVTLEAPDTLGAPRGKRQLYLNLR